MELSYLRVFQAVAEEGSITRAATRLHRVPSNLSTRLRQLEESLGVELFLRERQRLTLSPAGKVMLGYAERMFALQADGWYLRSDIVWAKGISCLPDYAGSCMPEPVRDRPVRGHEYVFLLSKRARYFYDAEAVKERAIDYEHHLKYHSAGGNGASYSNKQNAAQRARGGDGRAGHGTTAGHATGARSDRRRRQGGR